MTVSTTDTTASASQSSAPPADLTLAYIEFFVADAEATAAQLADQYGFRAIGTAGSHTGDSYRVALRNGDALLVVTQGNTAEHPAARYVAAHGDGVADIAMATGDLPATTRVLATRGADVQQSGDTTVVAGFGDVTHTLLRRSSLSSAGLPPGFRQTFGPPPAPLLDNKFLLVDHIAVTLPSGGLDDVVEFYQRVFGFDFVFEERIEVGAQAMLSKVVQGAGATVTLTLLEPDVTAEPGQIDDFLERHGGAGVQHVALSTKDIVGVVGAIADRGVEFLSTPASYYDALPARLSVRRHSVPDLRDLGILVDEDHDGQLFQIFARSTHPRRTFFFEVIERFGARTFGSGNIKALYEAVAGEHQPAT